MSSFNNVVDHTNSVGMFGSEPICMYRLLFASVQLHVFWKSLICIRRFDRLEYIAVALLGVRTRRCLISDLIYYDHLGSQTLGAPLFRSLQLRFTNIVVALV